MLPTMAVLSASSGEEHLPTFYSFSGVQRTITPQCAKRAVLISPTMNASQLTCESVLIDSYVGVVELSDTPESPFSLRI